MKKALLGLSLLLPLVLLLALPAWAAEKPKDFIFRGMPDYQITGQSRNFERLTINTPKPESEEVIETIYEGNRVFTEYGFTGEREEMPSPLQICRNYQSAVKNLGGEILWDNDNNEFHASFTRNDKQYYMAVWVYGTPTRYTVTILEPTEMKVDVEIIDADTILHKLNKEGHIALYINFDTGQATIKPESQETIDEIVAALESEPQLQVKLEGHTDNVGNAAANKKLSDDRANAVMSAIVAAGIDQSRLAAEGFGLDKPIADNGTEEGRAKNRRVELVKVE